MSLNFTKDGTKFITSNKNQKNDSFNFKNYNKVSKDMQMKVWNSQNY